MKPRAPMQTGSAVATFLYAAMFVAVALMGARILIGFFR